MLIKFPSLAMLRQGLCFQQAVACRHLGRFAQARNLIERLRRDIPKDALDPEVNPDAEKVSLLLAGIFENEKNHGFKFCPCRLRTKDWDEDLKLICPCNFTIHETYKGLPEGECWCGLFVRRK
jgi:ferredoxin-thioredoxin reductase catalytic subunit